MNRPGAVHIAAAAGLPAGDFFNGLLAHAGAPTLTFDGFLAEAHREIDSRHVFDQGTD